MTILFWKIILKNLWYGNGIKDQKKSSDTPDAIVWLIWNSVKFPVLNDPFKFFENSSSLSIRNKILVPQKNNKEIEKMHDFDFFFLILFLTFKWLSTGSLGPSNYLVLFLTKAFLIKQYWVYRTLLLPTYLKLHNLQYFTV